MRQMLMRQIVADAISKFQKITRQMLCDKCSKNDVTLIPQTSYGGNITLVLKMLTSLPALYGGLHLLMLVLTGSRLKQSMLTSQKCLSNDTLQQQLAQLTEKIFQSLIQESNSPKSSIKD